jgi:hypothetical protein
MPTLIALLLLAGVIAGVVKIVKATRRPRTKYVTWTEPDNPKRRMLIVETETPEAAKAVALDHIERKYGIQGYSIDTVEPYTRPAGRVVGEA